MAEQELSLPPQPPRSSASADHSNPTLSSSAAKLSDETSSKLLNQVEYYFSDFNLATTDHLMRFIGKDTEGFVPISVVASFKKIKALVNGHRQLATILRNSSKLVVSEEGKKVKRLHPITESEMEELQSRIIVAENLPEDHCRQNLMKVFSVVGRVKAIRTCRPQAPNGGASSVSRSAKFDNMRYNNKLHAFVEYESVELAEKAVVELNDKGNRSGLRVRLMVKRMVGNRNKRSNNNSKKKKKKTTRNDDGNGGCLNYITPLNRGKTDEKLDSHSISEKESTKTPPIQASVSPEIQHLQVSLLSSSSSTTPVCYTYAAGHVLSGITDKRKCRPKGLLTVAAAQMNHSISNSHSNSIEDASLPLPLPSPTHASMHWLRLSPSDTYHHNDDSSLDTSSSKSLSSTPPLLFSRSSSVSPFSLYSLGTAVNITTTTSGGSSGNVICTPTSDSTSHTYNYVDDLSCLSTATTTGNTFTSQLDSVAQCLHAATLSSAPNNTTALDVQPFRDSVSIDSSFQFETLTASYASADLTHFRQLVGDHNSCNSCSSSQSGMMISSREMSMSEIYKMDEFDFCRCLSDEEGHDDANNTCIDANIFYHEPRVEEKGQQCREESYPHGSCAESISTDEGCLLASSTDSDSAFVPQKQ